MSMNVNHKSMGQSTMSWLVEQDMPKTYARWRAYVMRTKVRARKIQACRDAYLVNHAGDQV